MMLTAPDANGNAIIKPREYSKLKGYLIEKVRPEIKSNPPQPQKNNGAIKTYIIQAFEKTGLSLPEPTLAKLFQDTLNELVGFGPLQQLLEDSAVTEIMVNGPSKVYVEKSGKVVKSDAYFDDDRHIIQVIKKIVAPLGRRIDKVNPMVDARLPDGSRVNAVIPPAAIDGPSMTIRKFSKDQLEIEDLIQYKSVTDSMAQFLEACVNAKLNIVISGGTGSGKTTLLNILSGYIPSDERIVTIEDAAELQLHQDHVVRLETVSPDVDGRNGVDIRALVRNSLRMRPDRIVVGEVRGGEALDMLQAMNTGHDGSLTTVHANTPRDAISRLETLVLMAGMDLPIMVVREQIASAVDIIVQQSRLSDGSRKVTHITEVAGREGDTIVMTDIFKFERTGLTPEGNVSGELGPTGIRPMLMPKLEASGVSLGGSIFMQAVGNGKNNRDE